MNPEVRKEIKEALRRYTYAKDVFSEDKLIEALSQLIERERRDGEENGAAFAVAILDRLHNASDGSSETDRFYKGAKNAIRDQFKEETGVDPAPHYPTTYKLS